MRKVLAFFLSFILVLFAGGCGKVEDGIDPNKTQIYVSTFSGGLGSQWLTDTAKLFNSRSEQFQVLIADPNKDQYDVIRSQIETGVSRYDIYFNVNSDYVELAEGGYLENLNDVLESKPDGESGLTVKEKMTDKDVFLDAYSIKGNAYALPFTDLAYGFVYDYELFVQKDWFIYDGAVKSVGRDKIAGTYDDGLPVTLEEFDLLLLQIFGDLITPLNWSGKYVGYLTNFLDAVQAQYDGFDNYILSYSYDGVYSPKQGTGFEITPREGYKNYDMKGKIKALEFMQKYFIDASDYRTKKSELDTTTHANAQDNFIMSAVLPGTYERCAIHCDGEWWENEARTTFNALEKANHPEYAFGKHDYRFMPIPAYSESMGNDKNGGGFTIPILESGNVFVKKQSSEIKRLGAKEFLKFTLSDEALRLFTRTTGSLRPYEYELTEEDKAKMSKFSNSVMEIKKDPNATFVRPKLNVYQSPLNYRLTVKPYIWESKIGVYYADPYKAMNPKNGNATAAEVLASIKREMNPAQWQTIYEKYYKD